MGLHGEPTGNNATDMQRGKINSQHSNNSPGINGNQQITSDLGQQPFGGTFHNTNGEEHEKTARAVNGFSQNFNPGS